MTNSLNYMKTGPKVGLENAKNVDYEAFPRTMHQLNRKKYHGDQGDENQTLVSKPVSLTVLIRVANVVADHDDLLTE